MNRCLVSAVEFWIIIRSIYMHSMNRENVIRRIFIPELLQMVNRNIMQDLNNLLGDVGQDWFWIDVNFEKTFNLIGTRFCFFCTGEKHSRY